VTGSASLGWRSQRLKYEWTQSQPGNGVADSLPSGSGNLDVHPGRQGLPLTHPLHTLDLSQRPAKGSFQTGFVTESTRMRLVLADYPPITIPEVPLAGLE